MKYMFSMLLVCILFVGCSENSNPETSEQELDYQNGVVPLDLTNYWVYQKTQYRNENLIFSRIDTLRFDSIVTISSKVYFGSRSGEFFDQLCRNDYAGLWKLAGSEELLWLKYPVNIYDSWFSTTGVVFCEEVDFTYTVPVGTYSGCIRYESNPTSSSFTYIVKPGLGILHFQESMYNDNQELIQTELSLLEFHLR